MAHSIHHSVPKSNALIKTDFSLSRTQECKDRENCIYNNDRNFTNLTELKMIKGDWELNNLTKK